jgi:hypothetical protein
MGSRIASMSLRKSSWISSSGSAAVAVFRTAALNAACFSGWWGRHRRYGGLRGYRQDLLRLKMLPEALLLLLEPIDSLAKGAEPLISACFQTGLPGEPDNLCQDTTDERNDSGRALDYGLQNVARRAIVRIFSLSICPLDSRRSWLWSNPQDADPRELAAGKEALERSHEGP